MRDRQVSYLNRLATAIGEMLYLGGLDLDTLSDLTTILRLIGQCKARLVAGDAEESAPHAVVTKEVGSLTGEAGWHQ